MTPRKDKIFGCDRCFHVTALWYKVCVSLALTVGESVGSITHHSLCFRTLTRTLPYRFEVNFCFAISSFIHITTTGGDRAGSNAEKVVREFVRCWEYRISAAYASEFVQTLLGSRTGKIETTESLHLLEGRVGKDDAIICLHCPDSQPARAPIHDL